MLVVLENTYLEQMVANGFTSFCIFETNPFILENFTLNLVSVFYLHSKDQVFIFPRKNYLNFQSWLLLMGGVQPISIVNDDINNE